MSLLFMYCSLISALSERLALSCRIWLRRLMYSIPGGGERRDEKVDETSSKVNAGAPRAYCVDWGGVCASCSWSLELPSAVPRSWRL